jgi:hypothetical protein
MAARQQGKTDRAGNQHDQREHQWNFFIHPWILYRA